MKMLDKLSGVIAERHQTKHRRIYSQKYPQMVILAYDYIGIAINTHGRHESKEIDALFEHFFTQIPSDRHCLDIGANIGNHSLAFAEHFAMVHSFEPNQRSFRLLEMNAELRKNIACYNFGASDRAAWLEAVEFPLNLGETSINETSDSRGCGKPIRVEVKRLDKALSPEISTKIGLIKIDVEGHELKALKGCVGILRAASPIIVFEQQAVDFENGKSPVVEFLREQGYCEFYVFSDGTLEALPKGLRRLYKLLKLIITGHDSKLAPVRTEAFKPRFYAMIVASKSPLIPA